MKNCAEVLISKLGKAACRTMADSHIQKVTTAELIEAIKTTQRKSRWNYCQARVMDHHTIKQREAEQHYRDEVEG